MRSPLRIILYINFRFLWLWYRINAFFNRLELVCFFPGTGWNKNRICYNDQYYQCGFHYSGPKNLSIYYNNYNFTLWRLLISDNIWQYIFYSRNSYKQSSLFVTIINILLLYILHMGNTVSYISTLNVKCNILLSGWIVELIEPFSSRCQEEKFHLSCFFIICHV